VWRYLKDAFFVGIEVPGLGKLPLNALAVAACGILGFAEPSLWLLGLGGEAALLFGLVSSERFRKVVDARHLQSSEEDAETKRRALVATLPPVLQKRLIDLGSVCQKVTEVSEQTDEFTASTNRDALQRLEWVYLKLLVARNNMVTMTGKESESELAAQVRNLEASLETQNATGSLRQSKQATLAILKERLANIHRRQETLDEIDSDLTRIEAQAQLVLENTTIQGKPPTISTDIELASNLSSGSLFGDSGVAIADLEQTFGASTAPHRSRATEP